jgi:hypothetical protein
MELPSIDKLFSDPDFLQELSSTFPQADNSQGQGETPGDQDIPHEQALNQVRYYCVSVCALIDNLQVPLPDPLPLPSGRGYSSCRFIWTGYIGSGWTDASQAPNGSVEPEAPDGGAVKCRNVHALGDFYTSQDRKFCTGCGMAQSIWRPYQPGQLQSWTVPYSLRGYRQNLNFRRRGFALFRRTTE